LSEKLFTVGKIVNTHGIRGELKIMPQTDFPEERFRKGSQLLIERPGQRGVVPVTVEAARPHKQMYIVKLAGFDNINDVLSFKNSLLRVSEKDLVELGEGEYYFYEIIGCTVVTDEGRTLGKISEILRPGANDVWVVERPQGKPVYIPYIDDVVLDVDVAQKRVTVHVLEGLIDE